MSARFKTPRSIKSTVVEYYTWREGQSTTNAIAVESSNLAVVNAEIPAQPEGTLVRFAFRLTDDMGVESRIPSPYEARSAYGVYVANPPARGKIPQFTIIKTARLNRPREDRRMQLAREDLPEGGTSALFYVPSDGDPQLFDFVEVRPRSGGWKVHFLKDQLLEGMSAINVIREGPNRWMLAEHLAYELYRRAGLRIQESGYSQVTVDGRAHGVHLWVEQPNKTFLRRTGRDDQGNLYKIRWFENDLVRKHEKKTNRDTGHEDLVTLVNTLRKKSGEDQWRYIEEQFDLANAINYFAVNMCIQNWDGFFNNYFTYHDPKRGGKWEIIPWDEDKTWGYYDGASHKYDWYDMPLTVGMHGDRPKRNGWFGGGGPFGGTSWWRPAGPFSGPLLANPQFRERFEARLKELCNTVFTEEKFYPVIQGTYLKLKDEMANDVDGLERDIESFRKQVTNRREFILGELNK